MPWDQRLHQFMLMGTVGETSVSGEAGYLGQVMILRDRRWRRGRLAIVVFLGAVLAIWTEERNRITLEPKEKVRLQT